MLHEEPPDQIAPVADAVRFDPVGCQHEPRVLDRSAGEHEVSRLYPGMPAAEGAQLDRLHRMRRRVAYAFGGVGVQKYADIRGLAQVFPVDFAEAGRGGDPPEVEFQPRLVEGEGFDVQLPPDFLIWLPGSQRAERAGEIVPGFQFL